MMEKGYPFFRFVLKFDDRDSYITMEQFKVRFGISQRVSS